jgi:N-acetyl-gamma-glutamyl-phosphate reductase
MSIKTAIIGASGYTGAELLRIIASHPKLDVSVLVGKSTAGQSITTLYPHLQSYQGMVIKTLEEATVEEAELVFLALPHGATEAIAPTLKNKIVIDLSADFRLPDPALYEQWYGRVHAAPEELPKWVYGIPELFGAEIREATRIANPGCYPTSIALATAPLAKAEIIGAPLIVNSYSGTSGAGRKVAPGLHYAHVHEDMRAYKIGNHQHTPEIEMAISKFAGKPVVVSFTPHLAPTVRGIHSTIVAQRTGDATTSDILSVLRETYANAPFVSVMDTPPGTKEVRASNACHISATADERTGLIIITSVIDNLVKGAAGQAVQNANCIFGFDETLGLSINGVYP